MIACSLVHIAYAQSIFADKASLQAAVIAYNADAASATATYGPISSWDVSAITNMNHLFESMTGFNGDISGWNTSRVTNMDSMFEVCASRVRGLHPSRGLCARVTPLLSSHSRVTCLPFNSAHTGSGGIQPAAEF